MASSGVRAIAQTQWKRDTYWLYGAIEPETGEQFYLELSHVDQVCFERFLHDFSAQYPESHHVMQVDNAAFHTAKKINVPVNISLIFQPPHSPDTNPIERVWSWIKSKLQGNIFPDIHTLKEEVWKVIEATTPERISSMSYWPHIRHAVESFRS